MSSSDTPAATPPPGAAVIQEGQAKVYYKNENEVFYNPVQQFNRDLSILTIKMFTEIRKAEIEEKAAKKIANRQALAAENKPVPSGPLPQFDGITILEALAATGLRSIRYCKELPDVKRVLANDYDEAAVSSIRSNAAYNGVSHEKLVANQGEAAAVMYAHKAPELQYDVVDIDPYGSASPFIDSAVQAVRNGGLLCVTCTDMAVLCGNHMDACFSKYGSVAIKNSKYCHELALRILMHAVSTSASRYRRYIEPLYCVSVDFYVRCFVRVHDSAAEVKKAGTKLSYVHQCVACDTFHLQPLMKATGDPKNPKITGASAEVDSKCDVCGRAYQIGGPFWSDPLHNVDFTQKALTYLNACPDEEFQTKKRLIGVLTTISEELPDRPLFYQLSSLCSTTKTTSIPLKQARSAFHAAGYRLSHSHTDPQALKTDAPTSFIWDMMRSWAQLHPVKANPATIGGRILATPPSVVANFDLELPEPAVRVARYLPNPEPNWGPKARATGKKRSAEEANVAANENAEKQVKTAAETEMEISTNPVKE